MIKQRKDKTILVRVTTDLHKAIKKYNLNAAHICRRALEHKVQIIRRIEQLKARQEKD